MLPQARLRIVNTHDRFVVNPVAASLAS